MPAAATIGWNQTASAESTDTELGTAELSDCTLSSVGHAQDIPGGAADWLLAVAAEPDGWADVHAESASARATATPKTPATGPGRRCPRPPRDHGLAIAFPTDSMLATIDASLPAGISGAVVVWFGY